VSKSLLLAIALGVLFACSNNPTGPTAGTLKVNLVTPNSGADGAILLTLSGPIAITSASAGAGLRLFSQPPLGTANHFILTGTLAGGTILTIGVADVAQASAYSASIQQVAQPNYQLRPLLTGYSLTVTR
jgi:hypothetical protein